MKNIILLGATGSVGSSVLDIIRKFPDRFKLLGFSAWNNTALAASIIQEFSPRYAVLKQQHGNMPLLFPNVEFLYGEDGLHTLSQIKADSFVSALIGLSGLIPAVNILNQGCDLIIANKESLVAGGVHLKAAAAKSGASIIPLDSEHLALFDLLRGIKKEEIAKLIITASGGPFLHKEITPSTPKSEVGCISQVCSCSTSVAGPLFLLRWFACSRVGVASVVPPVTRLLRYDRMHSSSTRERAGRLQSMLYLTCKSNSRV